MEIPEGFAQGSGRRCNKGSFVDSVFRSAENRLLLPEGDHLMAEENSTVLNDRFVVADATERHRRQKSILLSNLSRRIKRKCLGE